MGEQTSRWAIWAASSPVPTSSRGSRGCKATAIAELLGIEAVPRQSTLSRFVGAFTMRSCAQLAGLHAWALRRLPSRARPREGYTLDLNSWALLHEDGHQQGVVAGDSASAKTIVSSP